MSTLHVVNSGPKSDSINRAMASLGPKDNLVLMGEGIYSAQLLQEHPLRQQCYVMADDITARGIRCDLKGLSYDELVELVCHHSKQISWG